MELVVFYALSVGCVDSLCLTLGYIWAVSTQQRYAVKGIHAFIAAMLFLVTATLFGSSVFYSTNNF